MLRALQLGDLLCTVPAFRALRAAFPHSHIALVGLPWARSFVDRFTQYLDEFIEFPGFPGVPERPVSVASVFDFMTHIYSRRFDLLLQMQGNGRHTNHLAVLLNARIMAGYFEPGDYCPDQQWFMPYPEDQSEVRRHLALMNFLGIPSQGEGLEFPLTAADEAAYARLHDIHDLEPASYICIHPGGRGHARRWSPEYFGMVANQAAERGYRIVVTGTAEERKLVDTMKSYMCIDAIDVAGQTNLGTMGALLSHAYLLIANNNGVSHLAAALNVPSIIVCIGSDPIQWSPLDKQRHRMLMGSQTTVEGVIAQFDDLLRSRSAHRSTFKETQNNAVTPSA